MTQVQEQLAAAILHEIQALVGATQFNNWFRNAADFALENNELRVGVPNLFACEYLESRFSKVIAEVARRTVGPDLAVRFHIDPLLFAKRRSQQLAQTNEFLDQQTNKGGMAACGHALAPDSQPARHQTTTPTPSRPPEPESGRPLLTLDRFVIGESNRVAYAAAFEVAVQPGQSYNPLFIHGACGLGKTHLLQGIVRAIRQRNPQARVLYITAEEFTNRYILAVKTHSIDAFRQRFRSLECLVIDDIHFLSNKEATQEEFLHTFNTFNLGDRQVVMASDSHPRDIASLQDGLVNRFVSGLVARITAPDRQTRVEILRRKAARDGHNLPADVLDFVAQHVTASVRELEGALTRILAFAALEKSRVTLALARQALADHLTVAQRSYNLDRIIDTVARHFTVSPADLIGDGRTRSISLPRQVAMLLARRLTPLSYPDLGRRMGGKNHTTVIAACRRMEALIAANDYLVWHEGAVERRARAAALIEDLEDQLHR